MDPVEELEDQVRNFHNRFRGRVCGYVEALNLTERQERAIISTIKSLSYDMEKSVVDAIAAHNTITE